MSCPYLDCDQKTIPSGVAECPRCKRLLKACPLCKAANRSFANFCWSCGQMLHESEDEWSASRGGPRRLGWNPSAQAAPLRGLEIREVLGVHLGEACRSLLSYDRHLIAIGKGGALEVTDVSRRESVLRLTIDGPVTCEPCISRGMLFVGSPGHLTAYALGSLTRGTPRLDTCWEIPLPGIPLHALTVVDNRLYVTLVLPGKEREVRVIEEIHRPRPGASRRLRVSARASCTAGDPSSRHVFFLSEEEGEVWVHAVDSGAPQGQEITSRRIERAPWPLAEPVPVAVLDGKIFAVLGETDRLCRIDPWSATLDQVLREDVKAFALNGQREGVHVETAGVVFQRQNVSDSLNPYERVKGSPVLVGDCAAVLGMHDGRIRVYDLQNPPRYEIVRVAAHEEEVTALASFRSYFAAGDAQGEVKVFELAASPGRAEG